MYTKHHTLLYFRALTPIQHKYKYSARNTRFQDPHEKILVPHFKYHCNMFFIYYKITTSFFDKILFIEKPHNFQCWCAYTHHSKGIFFIKSRHLEHGLVGAAGSGPVDQRVPRAGAVFARAGARTGERDVRAFGVDSRRRRRGGGAAHKQLLEGLPELTRHAAVDGEVDRVRDDDEEVGEEDERVGDVVVEDLADARRDDVQHGDDGHRDLHQQEHAHHHHQHQGGAVGVAKPLALALAVLLEEALALHLRHPHRSQQHQVQKHQRDAWHQVHEQHPETRTTNTTKWGYFNWYLLYKN